jgi:hypothetical protein
MKRVRAQSRNFMRGSDKNFIHGMTRYLMVVPRRNPLAYAEPGSPLHGVCMHVLTTWSLLDSGSDIASVVLGSQDMQEIYSLYLPHAVQACNHSVSLQGNIPREEDEGKLVELGLRSATEGWKFCWLRGRTLQDPCLA